MRTQFKFRLKKPDTMHYISPDEKVIVLSKRAKDFLALKTFISRRKYLFLASVAALLVLFAWLYSFTHYYKSEATVSFSGYEIPEYDESQNSRVPWFAQLKESSSRFTAIIYSKEMFDHLIAKFDLYKHYGIEETNENYGRLRQLVKSAITVYSKTNSIFAIRVSDNSSPQLTAAMANEIADKANDMNRNYIASKLENRMEIYSRLHGDIKSITENDIASLQPVIASFKNLLTNPHAKNIDVERSIDVLSSTTSKIQSGIQQLIDLNKASSWSLSSVQKDVLPTIVILEDALPGVLNEIIPLWILIPLAVICAFIISISIFSMMYSYGHYFRLLFS